VHYHTGFVDEPRPLNASTHVLRQRLVAAQERMLHYASEVWNAQTTLCGEVLDVGCGLGGGSLFWAQEFDAQVTAVTIAPSHVDWVTRFAAQAGVASRVQPLVCNALEVPGNNCFDAAVAVDSSSSLPRTEWFQRLAALLRPGGRVFISDCFLERSEYEELFNRHWYACIGMIDEYVSAARDAGLRTESVNDISHHTEHFWEMTVALMQAEVCQKKLTPPEAAKFDEALQAHSLVRQGLADGGYRYALMSFCKN
jgi:cyclopropane fatty-acyl-phospholipid synthase-like methyltransferase